MFIERFAPRRNELRLTARELTFCHELCLRHVNCPAGHKAIPFTAKPNHAATGGNS